MTLAKLKSITHIKNESEAPKGCGTGVYEAKVKVLVNLKEYLDFDKEVRIFLIFNIKDRQSTKENR